LLASEEAHPGVVLRFVWRLHYFIGELVIQVQQFLVQQQQLVDCVLLTEHQIHKVTLHFIRKLESRARDEEFMRVRERMASIVRSNLYDLQTAIWLYSHFVQISVQRLNYEMVLDYDWAFLNRSKMHPGTLQGYAPQVSQDWNPERNGHIGNGVHSANNREASQLTAPAPVQLESMPVSNGLVHPLPSGTIAPSQKTGEPPEKGLNHKWTATE
jgi:hypothetical protein